MHGVAQTLAAISNRVIPFSGTMPPGGVVLAEDRRDASITCLVGNASPLRPRCTLQGGFFNWSRAPFEHVWKVHGSVPSSVEHGAAGLVRVRPELASAPQYGVGLPAHGHERGVCHAMRSQRGMGAAVPCT